MEFISVGQGDPFLLVKLNKGEKITCESDAMVMMDSTLELNGEMKGGFISALARNFLNGESFFQQSIEAKYGSGDCLLSPELPGDLQILKCDQYKQYRINDSAFLACSSSISFTVERQSLSNALFSGTGGFFVMKTNGVGEVVVSGLGTVMELDVTQDNPIIIDNNHVVAWDEHLNHKISVTTRKGGFLGNMINGLKSGEGMVTQFSGNGKVIVCSRNRGAFVSWLSSQIMPKQ